MTPASNDNVPREPWITFGATAFFLTIALLLAALLRNVVDGGSLSVTLLVGAALTTIILAVILLANVKTSEER